MLDLVQLFETAMREKGLGPTAPIVADGERHRYTPEGDSPGSNAGWYRLHLDFPPSGAFGSWKTGQNEKWTHNPGRDLTDEERGELKKRIDRDRKNKEAEQLAAKEEAQKKAAYIWRLSLPVETHDYLIRKNIKAHGARVTSAGMLAIPVVNDSKLVGLQFISPLALDPETNETPRKNFLSGTPIEGSYSPIGDKLKTDVIVICEGYATGATIHEATGYLVFCAFNAGNLKRVAESLRARFADARIILAADDDRWTKKPVPNPGLHYAGAASASVSGELRRPLFPPGFEGRPTDFNDLAAIAGLEEVRHQIETGTQRLAVAALSSQPLAETAPVRQLGYADNLFLDSLPHQQDGKKPLCTAENVQEILRRIKATVRYNVIRKKEEILIAGRSYSLDNYDNASYADVLDACARFQMPTDKLNTFITRLADMNQYNPVATWIDSKPWDGVSRMQEFCSTVVAVGEQHNPVARVLKETLIKKWLISAVAAAYLPDGVSAHGVLVFQGAQYLGKTAWFKRLAPVEMRVIADGVTLDPKDKDSIAAVIQNWIVELGELDATFRKADIAQLKSYITKDRDVIRMPYAAKTSNYPRRTVFFASVNPMEFLADATGNRRFWTIACESINHQHEIDVQQVWAEAKQMFKEGATWFLDAMEVQELNAHNEGFSLHDPIEERIHSHYDWSRIDNENFGEWKTASDILKDVGIDRPTRHDLVNCASACRKLGKYQSRKTNGKKVLWVPRKGPQASAHF